MLFKNKKTPMPEVCIDVKKIEYTCDHLDNQANYAIGNCSKPPEEMSLEDTKEWKRVNYICFSGFNEYVAKFKKSNKEKSLNRIHLKLTVHNRAYALLNDAERERWIALSKMHGLLPPYIRDDTIEKLADKSKDAKKGSTPDLCGNFFIDIENIPASLLYVYLSTIRNLREDPGFPKVVIHLVDDLGMNFYGAYVFASRVAIVSTGHHIMDVYRPYGERYTSDREAAISISTKLTAPVRTANCLRRFIHEPEKHDKRKATDNCRLSAAPIINGINKGGYAYMLTLPQFLDENVVRAITSLTDKDFKKHMDAFTNKNKVMEAGKNG